MDLRLATHGLELVASPTDPPLAAGPEGAERAQARRRGRPERHPGGPGERVVPARPPDASEGPQVQARAGRARAREVAEEQQASGRRGVLLLGAPRRRLASGGPAPDPDPVPRAGRRGAEPARLRE